MVISNAFREAVDNGSIRQIRIMLKDSLLVDPTFAQFAELEEAAKGVVGLYDEHDGKAFINNPDEWDDAYMNEQMVRVVSNFSHERINHLKQVVHKLRPIEDKKIVAMINI